MKTGKGQLTLKDKDILSVECVFFFYVPCSCAVCPQERWTNLLFERKYISKESRCGGLSRTVEPGPGGPVSSHVEGVVSSCVWSTRRGASQIKNCLFDLI